MRVIVDLHLHSCYSRATSKRMHLKEIARFAEIKGLNIVGTGDFTHPKWLEEIQEVLVQEPSFGLYRVAKNDDSTVYFMVTTEVSTVFTFRGEIKKIHHLILTPNIETAVQINERLATFGNLEIDGRPTLNMSAPQLVEEVMKTSRQNMVIPAHVWTPWFSVFGAFSGFDKIEDCYQDMGKYIFALETGLSSDPPMNWRLSKLDDYALISNSDSHSFWPWRMGREANVFELKKPSYREILDALRCNDRDRFRFTIETDPAYGKYHWSGHRNCNVALSPKEAKELGSICPVCRRKITKGVEQRLEELADRPAGFKPENARDFVRLLPLSEIIKTVRGATSPYNQKVWDVYNRLVRKFNNEYAVMMDASEKMLNEVVDDEIAKAIVRVRNELVKVIPGYDGVYGKLVIFHENSTEEYYPHRVHQQNLTEFMR
ncbi:MAG: endonuclease Q family protein [Candidatus Bathyarchaeota archaeon]